MQRLTTDPVTTASVVLPQPLADRLDRVGGSRGRSRAIRAAVEKGLPLVEALGGPLVTLVARGSWVDRYERPFSTFSTTIPEGMSRILRRCSDELAETFGRWDHERETWLPTRLAALAAFDTLPRDLPPGFAVVALYETLTAWDRKVEREANCAATNWWGGFESFDPPDAHLGVDC